MIGFVLLAIYHFLNEGRVSLSSFFKEKAYVGLLLVFVAVLLSGINSSDTSQVLLQLKLKLPFALLPLAFYILRPIDDKTHQWIHRALIITMAVSTVPILLDVLPKFKENSLSIGQGKSFPTPIDHIHYSIILAYATVSAFILGIEAKAREYKIALFVAGIYLFGFAHFLSVRTGLALAYAGLGITLIWYIITRKQYVIGAAIAVSMMALPFIAFHTVEPFKRKINYMYWDFAKYKQGKGKSYSDSERLMSYEIAIDLIKKKPLVGHGIGDLKPIMIAQHKERFGTKEKYIRPHNQYLYILTAMGVLGAIVFFGGLFSPLVFAEQRHIFLIVIFALMSISFLVENTVQRALITAFFLFFILLNLGKQSEVSSTELEQSS